MQLSKRVVGLITVLFFVLIGVSAQGLPEDYSVEIDPDDFVDVIDNPYYPRMVGMRWIYSGETAEGLERIIVEVLPDTREVMGVRTTQVRDMVFLAGELVEDTIDFFAQDNEGNVWYFGEAVKNYEDGVVVDTEGSWIAGVDGALPGILMYADPASHIGETYYNEYYIGEAEDAVILMTMTATVTVNTIEYENVLMTYDFTPLDPAEAHEVKYYAQGIGTIKELDLTTGEEFLLVEFTTP